MAHKEVLLEKNHITNEWRRNWYLHYDGIVETVDYATFKASLFPDVSKYDENGCL